MERLPGVGYTCYVTINRYECSIMCYSSDLEIMCFATLEFTKLYKINSKQLVDLGIILQSDVTISWVLVFFMVDKHADESNGVIFHIDPGKIYSNHFVKRLLNLVVFC